MTPYQKDYVVKDEHIDFQGIMDGLYYPFYLEDCRHAFSKDVLDFDLHEQAAAGINVVLSQYTLKFQRSLKKGDAFTITCTAHPDSEGKPFFHLKQEIRREGKLIVTAIFTATCVKATGGRSFLPQSLAEQLKAETPSNGTLQSAV